MRANKDNKAARFDIGPFLHTAAMFLQMRARTVPTRVGITGVSTIEKRHFRKAEGRSQVGVAQVRGTQDAK